jgi:hypothetical protein
MTALSPLRRGRITGSRIPKLFNVSPYGDRDSLMRELVREHFEYPEEFTGNIATRWGLEHEPEAVADYRIEHPDIFVDKTGEQQETVIHPQCDFLAITPDGILDDHGYLEVKCPYSGTYTHISQRPDYQLQVNLGLEVTGRDWAHFYVWRPDGAALSTVEYDPWWLETKLPEIEKFLAEFNTIVADPELTAPFLADPVIERSDDDWFLAATDYLEACMAVEAAQTVKDAAKDKLVALRAASPDLPAKGAGVTLIQNRPRKSVAYKEALTALAPSADLTPFTKEQDEVSWSVRRTAAV